MVFVPTTSLHQAVAGKEHKLSSFGEEENIIDETVKELEKFEISHGRLNDSIIKYGGRHRRPHHKSTTNNNNNNDNNNSNNNNNDEEENDTNWDKLYGLYGLTEPFEGSKVVNQRERVLLLKSVLVGILFVIMASRQMLLYCRQLPKIMNSFMWRVVIMIFIFLCLENFCLENNKDSMNNDNINNNNSNNNNTKKQTIEYDVLLRSLIMGALFYIIASPIFVKYLDSFLPIGYDTVVIQAILYGILYYFMELLI